MPQFKPSRHLWVGNFPEGIKKERIIDYFSKFGRVEEVYILPQKHHSQGIAAFIDFIELGSAVDACSAKHRLGGRELRVNFKFSENSPSPREREPWKSRRRYSRSSDKSSGSDSSTSTSSTSGGKTRKLQKKAKESSSGDSSSSSSDSSDSSNEADNDDRKRLGVRMKVTNLNSRPTDQNIEEVLSSEFKGHGSPQVRVHWDKNDRYAVLKFKSPEEARKACNDMQGAIIFGQKIRMVALSDTSFHGDENPGDMEVDPKANRCLFVGNIPKGVSVFELRDAFLPFGTILDAQIKKMTGNSTYGFVHFLDLMSAVMAKRRMDGTMLGISRLKVGFGKGSPSKAIWLDGIDPHTSEVSLERLCSKYGEVMRLNLDRHKCSALVVYDNIDVAKDAVTSLNGTYVGKSKVRAISDFASREAMTAFIQSLNHPNYHQRMYDPVMVSGGPMVPGMSGYYPPPSGPRGGMMGYWGRQYPGGGGSGSYKESSSRSRSDYPPPQRRESEDRDDYELQLKEFAKKRQREKDRERHHKGYKRGHDSNSSSDESRDRRHGRTEPRRTTSETHSEQDSDLRSVLNKRRDHRRSSDSSDLVSSKSSSKGRKKSKKTKSSDSEQEDGDKRNEKLWSPPIEESESGNDQTSDKLRKVSDSSTEIGPISQVGKNAPKTKQNDVFVEQKLEKDPHSKLGERGEKTVKSPPHKRSGPRTPLTSDDEGIPYSNEEDMDQGCVPRPRHSPSPRTEDQSRKTHQRELSPFDSRHGRRNQTPPFNRQRHSPGSPRHRSLYRGYHRSPSPHDRHNRAGPLYRSPERYPGRRTSPPVPRNSRIDRDRWRKGYSRSRSPPPRDQGKQRSPQHSRRSPRRWSPRRPRDRPYGRARSRSPLKARSRSPSRPSKAPPLPRPPSPGSHRSSPHRYGNDAAPIPPPPPRPPRTPSATPPPPEEGHSQISNSKQEPVTLPPSEAEEKAAQARQPISFRLAKSVVSMAPAALPSSPERPEGGVSGDRRGEELDSLQQSSSGQPKHPTANSLLELLCRYPVMWQGHLSLKNETAAVQLHYLTGNIELAKQSLPQPLQGESPPGLKILQRMRLVPNQLEGVEKRMELQNEHCLLLALPCGRDPNDVQLQTQALKSGFITYLMQKQAAGIIDMATGSMSYVLHIFPPCEFSQKHLSRVAPDLLNSASDSGHLMIVVAANIAQP